MEFEEGEADPSDLVDVRSRRGARVGGGVGGLGAVAILAFFLLRACTSGGGFDLGSLGGLDQLPPLQPGGGIGGAGDAADVATGGGAVSPEDPQAGDVTFANVVVTDANDVWSEHFGRAGRPYDRTKLVLFADAVRTGCGAASADIGPFYCPADSRVYLDLAFWGELTSRFGAGGDFARAYVIAHEVGHHVQNELGISDEVSRRQQESPGDTNALSVRLELQADCLAGVWAHARFETGTVEEGDVDEAIRAAEAVGDDSIQDAAVGRVDPDTFTHGTSAQRVDWFRRGFESGSADRCDTFSVDEV